MKRHEDSVRNPADSISTDSRAGSACATHGSPVLRLEAYDSDDDDDEGEGLGSESDAQESS